MSVKRIISIVVPCFNEQEALPLFYEEICHVFLSLSDYDFTMILVDDGSTDHTLEEIKKLAARDRRVTYISFSRNFGKEAALFAGLEHTDSDLVCVMDCDLQDPPSLLGDMLLAIKKGADCAAARRVTRKGEPKIRSAMARLFYKLIRRISDAEIVDGARDFRLMRRQVVDAILQVGEYHRFSKGIFGWVGFKTVWIEYENVERVAGETKWSFFKLFQYAMDGIIAFSTFPLKLASIVGVLVSSVSLIYFLYIFIRTLVNGTDLPGHPSLMVATTMLGGFILLGMGIMGEYIARTYIQVKNRPIYIARECTAPTGQKRERDEQE